MQGKDYNADLVATHVANWQGLTKFITWSAISVSTILVLAAILLID